MPQNTVMTELLFTELPVCFGMDGFMQYVHLFVSFLFRFVLAGEVNSVGALNPVFKTCFPHEITVKNTRFPRILALSL
jgi:hypothetical protein